METEDRWYVRFRGHTLGPLTSEQVKSSVRRKELGPDDKLASTSNPAWRPLRTQAEFLRCWESLSRPVPVELTPLPSPKILWQKKRAPLPAAPEIKTKSTPKAPPAAPAVTAPPITVPTLSAAKNKKPVPVTRKTKPKKAKKAPPTRRPTKAALASIPEAPVIQPVIEAPVQAVAPAPASILEPSPSPVVSNPELAEETLSLLETLRDWNRKEQSQARDNRDNKAATAPVAAQMEVVAPVVIPETSPVIAASHEPAETTPKPGIELRLNLTLSKQFIFIFAAVSALAVAAIFFTFTDVKKMRGPADSRLPNPSSPTVDPSTENDPIPQLKAPTRPKRD